MNQAENLSLSPRLPLDRLKLIIEAALLASSQPMSMQQLSELFTDEEQIDRAQISMTLDALQHDCAGRGVELREVASGFRYQVRQDVHPRISRLWTEKPSRYSRALLETLALIAYRQPITRPEIEQIRGVVVSSTIIKTLEEREWIRVVGYRDVPGKPALFGTTRAFLDYFNLKSLDELPSLSEIRDLEDPQMRFDQAPRPVHLSRDLPIDPEASPVLNPTIDTSATGDDAHTMPAQNDSASADGPIPPIPDTTNTSNGHHHDTSSATAEPAAGYPGETTIDAAPPTEEPRA